MNNATNSTTTKNATDASIYRESARKLVEGESVHSCSCLAIQQTLGQLNADHFPSEVMRYIEVFKPPHASESSIWGLGWSEDELGRDREFIQNCRILALCFMAAMVEAGDA